VCCLHLYDTIVESDGSSDGSNVMAEVTNNMADEEKKVNDCDCWYSQLANILKVILFAILWFTTIISCARSR
jgi:hypothetical protein